MSIGIKQYKANVSLKNIARNFYLMYNYIKVRNHNIGPDNIYTTASLGELT